MAGLISNLLVLLFHRIQSAFSIAEENLETEVTTINKPKQTTVVVMHPDGQRE